MSPSRNPESLFGIPLKPGASSDDALARDREAKLNTLHHGGICFPALRAQYALYQQNPRPARSSNKATPTGSTTCHQTNSGSSAGERGGSGGEGVGGKIRGGEGGCRSSRASSVAICACRL